jgi:hypothetical protein
MIDVLQKLISDTKDGFETYLKDNKREDLLHRVDELFDYKVKELNEEVDVTLKFTDNIIYEGKHQINELNKLDTFLRKSVQRVFNSQLRFSLNIEYEDQKIFDEDLKVEEIKNLNVIFKNFSRTILDKIGLLKVVLVHNNTNELVSFDMRIKRFKHLPEELRNYKDTVYIWWYNTSRHINR